MKWMGRWMRDRKRGEGGECGSLLNLSIRWTQWAMREQIYTDYCDWSGMHRVMQMCGRSKYKLWSFVMWLGEYRADRLIDRQTCRWTHEWLSLVDGMWMWCDGLVGPMMISLVSGKCRPNQYLTAVILCVHYAMCGLHARNICWKCCQCHCPIIIIIIIIIETINDMHGNE